MKLQYLNSLLIICLLSIFLTSCSSFMYRRGFKAGCDDFNKTRYGKSISGWRAGYLIGLTYKNAEYDLKQSMKNLDKTLKYMDNTNKEKSQKEIDEHHIKKLEHDLPPAEQ